MCQAFLFWLVWLGCASGQDLVTLDNGSRLEGRIIGEKDGWVDYLLPSGRVQLRRDAIKVADQSRSFERYISYGWVLLKKKDFAQAETVYLEGIKKFGQDAEKKKLLAMGLLESGQGFIGLRHFEDARRTFQALLEADPSHEEGRKRAAETERMCRKIRKEIEGFRQALEESPDNDLARYQLGLRYESLGQPDHAREQYVTLLKQYPQVNLEQFDGRLDLLRGFIQKYMVVTQAAQEPQDSEARFRDSMPGGWERYHSSRLMIYHHNSELAKEVARIAEDLIPELEKDFNIPAEKTPYTLHIYRDAQEYVKATGRADTVGFCEEAGQVLLYQTAPRLLRSVVPHELVHATLYRRFRRLPSWLDEGLAVRYEWGRELYYSRVKDWLEKGNAFPLAELFEKSITGVTGEQREIFYGQAYTLVDYLYHEYGGQEKLLQFLEAVSSGKEIPHSLRAIYHVNTIGELEKLWMHYMEL